MTYEGGKAGEYPRAVAHRQGVAEVEKSLQTGKQRYGRDLFTAIPNDPKVSPEKTVIITEFSKQKPRINKFPVGAYDVRVKLEGKRLIFTPRKVSLD